MVSFGPQKGSEFAFFDSSFIPVCLWKKFPYNFVN